MDASLKQAQGLLRGASARSVARVLVRFVTPLALDPAPQNAQAVLRAIRVLSPGADLGLLQALAHFCTGQYVEAMRIWDRFDDMSSKALVALCLEAIGEPSWWGSAQAVHESGDPEAMAILASWMAGTNATPGGPHAARTASPDAAASEKMSLSPVSHHAFPPLRA